MPPSEPLALATAWARKVLNTNPGGDSGFFIRFHQAEAVVPINQSLQGSPATAAGHVIECGFHGVNAGIVLRIPYGNQGQRRKEFLIRKSDESLKVLRNLEWW